MTPMAQYLTKEIMKGKNGNEEVFKRKAALTYLMNGAKFFEISGIEDATTEVLHMLGNLSKDPLEAAQMAQESTAHLCFLPYPKMWLESVDDVKPVEGEKFDTTGTGKVRSAFVLEDSGDFMARVYYVIWSEKKHRGDPETRSLVDAFDCGEVNVKTAVYDYLEYVAGQGARAAAATAALERVDKLEEEFQNLIQQGSDINGSIDKVDVLKGLLTEEEILTRKEGLLAQSKVNFDLLMAKNVELGNARRDVINASCVMFIRYLLLLNEPKALETVAMDPHKGVLKDLRRVYGDRPPFEDKGWVQVTLHLSGTNKTGRGGNGGQGPEVGSVALHFCRKHLRIKRGKLEIVRGHWRGDPAKGLALRSYKVMP